MVYAFPTGLYDVEEELGVALKFGDDRAGVDTNWLDDATKGIFIHTGSLLLEPDKHPQTLFTKVKHTIYDNCCLM